MLHCQNNFIRKKCWVRPEKYCVRLDARFRNCMKNTFISYTQALHGAFSILKSFWKVFQALFHYVYWDSKSYWRSFPPLGLQIKHFSVLLYELNIKFSRVGYDNCSNKTKAGETIKNNIKTQRAAYSIIITEQSWEFKDAWKIAKC